MTSSRKGAGFGSPAFEWVAGTAEGTWYTGPTC